MSATDPKIYFANSQPGAVLIDSGSGTEYAHAYPQGALFFKWDDVAETLAIHATPFDAAPIVPARSWADYTCHVDGVAEPITDYRDLNNYVSAYCFYQPTGGSVTIGASEFHIGNVGGSHTMVRVEPPVTALSAYTAGMCLGTKFAIADAMRVSNGSGELVSIKIHDKSIQHPHLSVLLFSENPTSAFTDFTLLSWSNPDRPKLIRSVEVLAADYKDIGGEEIADIYVGKEVKSTSGSTSLYAVIYTHDTPTFATLNALSITFGFSRD